MAYYNPKTFTSKADAVTALEAANFKPTAVPDVFFRIASNIRSYVSLGQCRTGAWLIMSAPPVDSEWHDDQELRDASNSSDLKYRMWCMNQSKD